MDLCTICNSRITMVKKYNRHVLDLSIKGIIKASLPYLNPVIPNYAPRLKRIASRHLSPFKGNIFICETCGYAVMQDIPSDAEVIRYYENQYWAERSTAAHVVYKAKYKSNSRAEYQIKFVLNELQKADAKIKKVLEIGAAGACASLLFRDVWKNNLLLHACEPGNQWTSYYQECGINRVAEFFPFQAKTSFDYIHTSHWLEHVTDIHLTLSRMHGMLNKDGYVFVEVPNTEHFYWDFPQTDTPHIHFFTKESIKKLFNKYNFECIKIGEYGITFRDLLKGIPTVQDANAKGCFLRALFRKIEK